jgi:DNA ligase-associated metallophosphoesterase
MSLILKINNQQFELLIQKAVFWREEKTLVISDLHLGKASHFRKHGIAIPNNSAKRDLEKLQDLILEFQPNTIIFLGDLFHSHYNKEWDDFIKLRKQFSEISFILIKGNHDILSPQHFIENNILIYDTLEIYNILFSHEKKENTDCIFQFYGHSHPGIKIKGTGKLSVKLPCFAQQKNSLMLPAFGALTGLHLISKNDYEKIYAVGEEKIFLI